MEELAPLFLGKSKSFPLLWGFGWERCGLLGSLWGRHTSGWGQRLVAGPMK